MFFWYLKIIVIGKVQTSGLSSAATGKKYFRTNHVTVRTHSSLCFFCNLSLNGQLVNSVLSLLFRMQLLKKQIVIVNIQVRGKIQISLNKTNVLQDLELVSQFFSSK